MKIALVGKGGSGKTTLAALLVRRLVAIGRPVLDCCASWNARAQVGTEMVGWISRSAHIRAAERGDVRPISALEPANVGALDAMRDTVDSTGKDWSTYQRQAVDFHLRNAAAWANDRTGCDLADQVDPDFIAGPYALAWSGQLPSIRP